jgi:2-C-methyl-D-erythritol 4-phosphate cytidylyltransferase / 2-C-methyl-D-erythritol 2,4-cyclodiphosphate synthase
MHTALIVAAGSGSRMKLNQSKTLYLIEDKPMFRYSVDTFLSAGFKVVLVVSKKDYTSFINDVPEGVDVVLGGKTRQESVLLGLKHVSTPYVHIHDAARPLITKEAILNIANELNYHDAVLLAEEVSSSLKYMEDEAVKTINREHHILAQTPQSFLTEKIRQAYLKNNDAYDDDIGCYQAFYPDEKIKVVINNDTNIKVTYPKDLTYLKNYFKKEPIMRIGHSFDIHRLSEGQPLILGGLHIEHDHGLIGHSDADVLLHVIAEAIMGAVALGDLGTIFPDTDPAIKGIDSSVIVSTVIEHMRQKQYKISNVDATIYAEAPKLNPYMLKIRENISKLLEISIDDISIKATTYEKLDAIGNKQAIAAEAVVLLKRL